MAYFFPVALLLLLAPFAASYGLPPSCYPEYQCIYEFGSGASVISWDLTKLCSEAPGYSPSGVVTGAQGYVAQKPGDTAAIYFTVCGNVQTALVENGATPLFSRGASVQFFEPNCFSTPSDIGCPPEGSTCIDVTVNGPPADGTTGVCDGTQAPGSKCAACSCNCEVVSQPALPAFSQIVGSDTSIKPGAEGLNLSYPPVPAYASDNYECDINPVTQLPYERQFLLTLFCDPTVTQGLSQITLTEGPECSYTVQATTARACSASGNPDIFPVNCSESCPLATPSASPSPSPMPSTSAAAGFAPSVAVNVADRVGFTFLGAALAGGGVALFLAGAQRGWWGAPSVARGYKPALAGYGAVPATSV